MKTKLIAVFIICFGITTIFSQTNLNTYKYVIVPESYEFLREPNQYRLNELTQFLFEKYGFTAVMEGTEYPEDLIRNRCLALRSNVEKDSGMFKTKLTVVLKDCNDKVVFTSKQGESREKDYNKSYTMALRDAFTSMEALNYDYTPQATTEVATNNTTESKPEITSEIQKLKEEIKALKEVKQAEVEAEEEPAVTSKPYIEAQPMPATVSTPVKENSGVLYAQAIDNGFQLVDSTPKVVFKIKTTGLNNVFLVEGKNAIVYKKDNMWVLEHYENSSLKQQELNIKF